MHTSNKDTVTETFSESLLTFFACSCTYKLVNFLWFLFTTHTNSYPIFISHKSTADTNRLTTGGNSREDPDALGPGSLEDLGLSEWLRWLTIISKQHPKYDLNSNKGLFLGGLRFTLKRFHEDSSEEAIMTALKKHKPKLFAHLHRGSGRTLPLETWWKSTIKFAGFALILESNHMDKGILFMKKKDSNVLAVGTILIAFFRDDIIRKLICNEKQWELDTLGDIHCQESMQLELSR